nr:PD-(D/E)XK nuclease family protein [Lachnospiraceae bacterium]
KSVVIFDGFTGFTPVQNKLIGVLMEYAIDIHVALVLEDCIQDTEAKGPIQEHELFYLSKKTMAQLGRMADERQIMTEDPYKAQNIGISDICNLINGLVYNGDRKGEKLNNTPERPIRLLAARNPYEEAGMVISRIRQLIRQKGYHYRDIGVLTGDMESYRHPIERTFARHDIPFFVDRTEPVLLNPFIEYIRSFLRIMCENYSISSVFSYLKSHLTGFSDDDINRLENYCLASNIKGYSAWHKRFDLTTGEAGPDELLTLNGIREAFMEKIDAFAASLLKQKGEDKATDAAGAKEEQKGAGGAPRINAGSVFTIKEFATALYELIVSDGIEDKLKEYAAAFEETGERRLAAEYDRIYVRIMDILDEICLLIPDEKTDIRGFGKILDAGFAAIRIGAVPAGTDYVQIGDLTRSRFDHIKVLFIVGANDGAIPKISDSGGILSENERVFLTGMADDLVLAPTGREDIYTQQLYIYMALEKPEDMVFASYSRTDAGGKSLLPSYIIGRIREMRPDIRIETRESYPEYLEDEEEAFEELACAIYPVISGTALPETDKRVGDLLKYFLSDDGYRDRLFAMIDAGIRDQGRGADDTIGAALAHAIYGTRISTSITRLETYAGCAYRYFLEYGLKLHEREVFTVDARDMGSIFHDVMKAYSDLMQKGGYDWTDIEEAKRRGLMDKAVDIVMEVYMPRKLSSAARYTYMAQRVRNIMQRTGDIVNAQVRRGRFKPAFFEVDFDRIDDVASLDIRLSDDEMMRLRGRID